MDRVRNPTWDFKKVAQKSNNIGSKLNDIKKVADGVDEQVGFKPVYRLRKAIYWDAVHWNDF